MEQITNVADLTRGCKKENALYKLCDGRKNSADRKVNEFVLTSVKEGVGKDELLSKVGEVVREAYLNVPNVSKMEAEARENFSRGIWERFINWLYDIHMDTEGFKVLAEGAFVSMDAPEGITQTNKVGTSVDLFFENETTIEAMIISSSNYSGVSGGARNEPNKMVNDLKANIAWAYVNETFGDRNKELLVNRIYLKTDDKSGLIKDFVGYRGKKPTASDNEMRYDKKIPFADTLDAGKYSKDKHKELFLKAYEIQRKAVQECKEDCRFKELCEQVELDDSYREQYERAQARESVLNKKVEPNAEQMEAIKKTTGKQVLLCGPGSGKTATLVQKIIKLIDDKVCEPKQILALTYTNAAAGELAARVNAKVKNDEDADNTVHVSTVHKFVWNKIIKANANAFGNPKVLEEAQSAVLAEQYLMGRGPLTGFNYNSVTGEYGVLKIFLDKYNVWEKAEANGFDGVEALEAMKNAKNYDTSELIEAFEDFRAMLDEEGYMSYDQQLSSAAAYLESAIGQKSLKALREQYPYILVDEYQDANEDMDTIISLLMAGDNKLACVVGDDDQSIYAFRGGSNRFIREFDQHFGGADMMSLGNNYRSGEAIVRFNSEFISKAKDGRSDKPFNAIRDGGKVVVQRMVLPSGNVQAKALAKVKELGEIVQHYLDEGFKEDDICVICRKNKEVAEILRNGSFKAKKNNNRLPEDPFAIMLTDMLSIIDNPANAMPWFSLISLYSKDAAFALAERYGVDLYKGIKAEFGGLDISDFGKIKEAVKKTPELAKAKAFIAIYNVAFLYEKVLNNSLSLKDVILTVAKMAGIYKPDGEAKGTVKFLVDTVEESRLSNVKELLHFLNATKSFPKTGARVNLGSSGKVTLCTAHDSKGLEWPVVIVYNAGKYGVERPKEEAGLEAQLAFESELEEERRLLYVAMTRAMDRLHVITADESGETFCRLLEHIATANSCELKIAN